MPIRLNTSTCLLAAALLTLAACSDDDTGAVDCHDFLLEFSPATGDTVTASQGLKYIDITPGTGTSVAAGNTVEVNYSGYLLNGTQFETSCGTPVFRLTLGAEDVIDGFDLGIRGMRPGGVRRVIIPPELGYGNVPNGPIPANSTLVFDLQLTALVD